MTLEVLVIAAIRILGSLPVLRWAFAGAILAILIDLSDLLLMNLLHLGGVPDYQGMDKWLDQAYLALFLLVALRWRPLPAAIALTLYLYRLVGFGVYEATEERWLLLAFPNVFEFWFLYVAGRAWWRRRRGHPEPTYGLGSIGHAATMLVLLTAAKLGHEYVIHVARALDGFTAVEAIQATWDWLRPGGR